MTLTLLVLVVGSRQAHVARACSDRNDAFIQFNQLDNSP
jgi:hypothetical protein